MLKDQAKNNFLGQNGKTKLNCAQSIIELFYKDQYTLDLFKKHGAGQAPEGLCGAFYAVIYILEKQHPEKVKDFRKWIIDNLGAETCKMLKANKVSCISCVEKAAEYLEKKF
jgi:hypothetical protein